MIAQRTPAGKSLGPIREAWAEHMLGELRRRPRGLAVAFLMTDLRSADGWSRLRAERAIEDLVLLGLAELHRSSSGPVARLTAAGKEVAC